MSRRLVHAYTPRNACAELFKRKEQEVILAGPAGTGKSRACLEKLHLLAILNPGMRGLITRKTQTSLAGTALDTWRKFVITEATLNGDVEYYGGSAEHPPQYRYKNGSAIFIGGLDKPIRIMSSEYDVVYVQEATELNLTDWEFILTRLRNWKISFQQIIADCNPSAPTHWLKKRAATGKLTMLESRHEDNPRLFTDDGEITPEGVEYMKKLDALTGVRYLRLRLGQWVAAEGMIYEEFDTTKHLVDPFEIPEDWQRYWSVDFGYSNPFVCQWWAEDPDGRLFMYREIYHSQRLVRDHAKQILDQVVECQSCCGDDSEDHICWKCPRCYAEWTEPEPLWITCDHDAEGRAQLEKYLGLGTTAANKEVSNGIQAVQARLKRRGDGTYGMHFMRGARIEMDAELSQAHKPTSTEEEIPGYVWARTKDDQAKEEPVKEDDHGMDAARYVVAEVDLGVQPSLRFVDYQDDF